jgi:molybdenum cofactor cytidylyltransferase
LNKIGNPARLAAARQIAAELLQASSIDSVALGAVQSAANPIHQLWSRSGLVVLAAGGSSRFGSPKQLARWQGQTFIERAVDTALAAAAGQPVVVVLGAEIEQSRALLKDKPIEIIINHRWGQGQSTSMQAGLAALPGHVGSAIFVLVDLPQLTPDVLTALIDRHRQTLAPIVWPEFEGQRGNPVLFDRALFPELKQIRGDTGGRALIKMYAAQAERVAVENPAVLQDFDRPEDLAEAHG